MSNFDRLKQLDSKVFWESIESLRNGLSKYIDYPAWLDSDDADLTHFLRSDEKILVYPSEAEIANFVNETKLINGSCSDLDIAYFKHQHKSEYSVLGHEVIFGHDYVIVADLKTMSIKKIPVEFTAVS